MIIMSHALWLHSCVPVFGGADHAARVRDQLVLLRHSRLSLLLLAGGHPGRRKILQLAASGNRQEQKDFNLSMKYDFWHG
jgi:hypothetical protein